VSGYLVSVTVAGVTIRTPSPPARVVLSDLGGGSDTVSVQAVNAAGPPPAATTRFTIG